MIMNSLFAFQDKTLNSTLSTTGTAWSTTLPLNNLKNKLRSKVARSAGVTTAHTKFDIDLGSAIPIRILSILNHNFSANATVKLSFGTTLGGTEKGTVSGLPVWNPFYPDNTNISAEDLASYIPSVDFWYALSSVQDVRYVRVEITDTGNTAGYVELGRCFVSNAFEPNINVSYGFSIAWLQDYESEKSLGGTEWFNIKSQGREFSGELSELSESEGLVHVFDRQRKLGSEGELYFIFDSSDTFILKKQRAMLCRFANQDALQYPYFQSAKTSFNLKEVL